MWHIYINFFCYKKRKIKTKNKENATKKNKKCLYSTFTSTYFFTIKEKNNKNKDQNSE